MTPDLRRSRLPWIALALYAVGAWQSLELLGSFVILLFVLPLLFFARAHGPRTGILIALAGLPLNATIAWLGGDQGQALAQLLILSTLSNVLVAYCVGLWSQAAPTRPTRNAAPEPQSP